MNTNYGIITDNQESGTMDKTCKELKTTYP